MSTLRQQIATVLQVLRLPTARLHFHTRIDPEQIARTYRYFTKPHPRYKLIRNKTLGAALLDLRQFDQSASYLSHILARHGGAYHAKRARARGYVFAEIERNDHVEAIHAINTSVEMRQGRPMDQNYQEKCLHFDRLDNFRYYGILNPQGLLVAYANLGNYGNFAAFSQLIGLRNNDGIMHLLVIEIVSRLIEDGAVQFLMYDTFFGAQPGLQAFKRMLGFQPYRAHYSLQ
ncbi:MAG: hypothetical protein V4508_13225 [Pseudomonadota bacterium]